MEQTNNFQLIFFKHRTIHQRHDVDIKPYLKEIVKRSFEDVDRVDVTQSNVKTPLNIQLHTMRIDFFDTQALFYFFGFLKDYATSDFCFSNLHFYTINLANQQKTDLTTIIHKLYEDFNTRGTQHTLQISKDDLSSLQKLKNEDNMAMDIEYNVNMKEKQIDLAAIETTKYLLLELRADPLKEKLEAITYWSRLVKEELYWRCRYEYENAVCNTLGGAYATLKRLWKSKDFAVRQLFLAKKVGDDRLVLKSRLFICLYYISDGQFQIAHEELNSVEKAAIEMEDEQLVGLVEYSRMRLEERIREENNKTNINQLSSSPKMLKTSL